MKIDSRILAKIGRKVKENQTELVLAMATVLISVLSFQAGKIYTLSHLPGTPASLQPASAAEIFIASGPAPTSTAKLSSSPPSPAILRVVGSKNSNKYHFQWCPGAGKISSKNKVVFTSEAAALAAGYVLASNCQK